ncbi:winged helix-turn-helix domain-containing protein [Ningiella sp. W23]|uniref:winged helix-turn-helix domain-containing protein n=1 Tax=Ningiella sp. W23 TaxID=3023715 RepID=UPI00375794DF
MKTRPFGKGISAVHNALEHLGYVQIDTISVIERAHHHVLFTRANDYCPSMLDKLLSSKFVFEYWSHAAAYLPISHYRFSLPYKHALKNGKTHWHKNPDRKLMQKVLHTIERGGPMRSRDFEGGKSAQNGWWNWKPAKKAIEQLFMEGDLMIARRDGFQKVYDLTERVLPVAVDCSLPTLDEFAEYLIREQLKCHGVVAQKSFTYLRKNPELNSIVHRKLKNMLKSGELEEVMLPSGARFVCTKSAFDEPMQRLDNGLKILSPFDNSTIQRQRLSEIFNFDYQIECYVPQAKRKYGYFSLPMLYRDMFIGRMDCKALRSAKRLQIRALYFEASCFESNVRKSTMIDLEKLALAFAKSVMRFSRFQSCNEIVIDKVEPAFMKPLLTKALRDEQ